MKGVPGAAERTGPEMPRGGAQRPSEPASERMLSSLNVVEEGLLSLRGPGTPGLLREASPWGLSRVRACVGVRGPEQDAPCGSESPSGALSEPLVRQNREAVLVVSGCAVGGGGTPSGSLVGVAGRLPDSGVRSPVASWRPCCRPQLASQASPRGLSAAPSAQALGPRCC